MIFNYVTPLINWPYRDVKFGFNLLRLIMWMMSYWPDAFLVMLEWRKKQIMCLYNEHVCVTRGAVEKQSFERSIRFFFFLDSKLPFQSVTNLTIWFHQEVLISWWNRSCAVCVYKSDHWELDSFSHTSILPRNTLKWFHFVANLYLMLIPRLDPWYLSGPADRFHSSLCVNCSSDPFKLRQSAAFRKNTQDFYFWQLA